MRTVRSILNTEETVKPCAVPDDYKEQAEEKLRYYYFSIQV